MAVPVRAARIVDRRANHRGHRRFGRIAVEARSSRCELDFAIGPLLLWPSHPGAQHLVVGRRDRRCACIPGDELWFFGAQLLPASLLHGIDGRPVRHVSRSGPERRAMASGSWRIDRSAPLVGHLPVATGPFQSDRLRAAGSPRAAGLASGGTSRPSASGPQSDPGGDHCLAAGLAKSLPATRSGRSRGPALRSAYCAGSCDIACCTSALHRSSRTRA